MTIDNSRSGSSEEFAEMVRRCNDVGVRVYVDAVLNHMATVNTVGDGSGGSEYNTTWDNRDFPGVPYDVSHFTPRSECPSETGGVLDYDNPKEVRDCYVAGELFTCQI